MRGVLNLDETFLHFVRPFELFDPSPYFRCEFIKVRFPIASACSPLPWSASSTASKCTTSGWTLPFNRRWICWTMLPSKRRAVKREARDNRPCSTNRWTDGRMESETEKRSGKKRCRNKMICMYVFTLFFDHTNFRNMYAIIVIIAVCLCLFPTLRSATVFLSLAFLP